jgi:hypothetical protein
MEESGEWERETEADRKRWEAKHIKQWESRGYLTPTFLRGLSDYFFMCMSRRWVLAGPYPLIY